MTHWNRAVANVPSWFRASDGTNHSTSINELFADAYREVIPAGSPVLSQGLRRQHIGLVERGIVRQSLRFDDGKQTLLGLHARGWWMGVDALLCETPTPYSVTALTSVIIVRFPEEQVARALASDRQLSLAMLGSLSGDLLLSHTRQKARCHIAEHDCGRIDV